MTTLTNHGSCLCGSITFEVHGPMRDVITCHCIQCRKMTGHYMAAANCQREDLKFTSQDNLQWYRASDMASRGFCGKCGSSLFWQADDADRIAICAGVLDGETGLKTARHIYVSWKGDYYNLTPEEPQFPESN